jgi:hypothetical protein
MCRTALAANRPAMTELFETLAAHGFPALLSSDDRGRQGA